MTLPRLEIGSGNNPAPGYVHADIDARMPGVDIVCGMEEIPRPDASFAEVRAVHCIEHVPLVTARRALREWHRVLAPGGRVYIDTPNIERNAAMYASGSWIEDYATLTPEQRAVCALDGVPNRGLWLNFKVFSDDDSERAWNLHRWNADPDLLVALLREAGFVNVAVIARSPSLIVQGFKE